MFVSMTVIFYKVFHITLYIAVELTLSYFCHQTLFKGKCYFLLGARVVALPYACIRLVGY